MAPLALARLCSGRVHYAWVVLAVMFTAMLVPFAADMGRPLTTETWDDLR